ncbi:MAG TPA: sugar phosphate isomerase/epimerase family protein [Flavisolibacter sp.]|nr:sugar phosphate isomerase/epimerase family protein [Flavisolibacter sp.]
MKDVTRRTFIRNTALGVGGLAFSSYSTKKASPRLSFSTLGCPDWSFQKIVDFAAQHQYQGLEIRGLLRQLDLPQCLEFSNAQNRKATMSLMRDKGLYFVGLGSSATLHFAAGTARQKNLDEGKRFIDLAQQIDCPYVRVFPNAFPKDQARETTLDLIAAGVLELAGHAKGSKVTVLMETHGELVKSDDLLRIMNAAQHKHSGLVWDIANMWMVTGESPVDVYKKLKKFIRHSHIKDANMVDGKPQFTLLGEGEVPIFTGIDELIKDNYKGYYSFEWEKMWHPEIAEPEVALAHFPVAFQKHLNKN